MRSKAWCVAPQWTWLDSRINMYIVKGWISVFQTWCQNVQLTLGHGVSWTLCAVPADEFDIMGNPCKWYSRSMKFAWWVHPILLFSRGRGYERKSLLGPCFCAFHKTTARFRASEQCLWKNIGQLIYATAGDFCWHSYYDTKIVTSAWKVF